MERQAVALAVVLGVAGTAFAAEGKWVVITSPDLKEAVRPLVNTRAAQGLEVVEIVTTDVVEGDILRREGAVRLREKLKELRPAEGKMYVLLVGAVVAGQEKAKVEVPTFLGTVGRMKGQPTDNGFGCLDEKLMPTVAVGRLPARNAAEATGMVEKILKFEKEGEAGEWRRRMALIIGNPGGTSTAERALANWYVNSAASSTAEQLHPLWSVRSIYHISGSPWYVPDERLHDESKRVVEAGNLFTFYLGHSSPQGFWSDNAKFLDAGDWKAMKLTMPGIFMTCGCWACQLDPQGREAAEGFGLAAMRNTTGPAAVIGASGESYSFAGQLAFTGMLKDLRGEVLPARLGDLFLDVKAGIDKGPMDFLTFRIFDYGDGTSGKVPLATQRLEHQEMWTLLGDPGMKMPRVALEIAMEGPKSVVAGGTVRVQGKLPRAVTGKVIVTLERPMSGMPAVREAVAGGTAQERAAGLMKAYEMGNDPVLQRLDVEAKEGAFEASLTVPAQVPWGHVVVRSRVGEGAEGRMGVMSIKVERIAEDAAK